MHEVAAEEAEARARLGEEQALHASALDAHDALSSRMHEMDTEWGLLVRGLNARAQHLEQVLAAQRQEVVEAVARAEVVMASMDKLLLSVEGMIGDSLGKACKGAAERVHLVKSLEEINQMHADACLRREAAAEVARMALMQVQACKRARACCTPTRAKRAHAYMCRVCCVSHIAHAYMCDIYSPCIKMKRVL